MTRTRSMHLIVALGLALAALAASAEHRPAQAAQGKPDLVVRSFGLTQWGSGCAVGDILFTFQVTVANVGTAPVLGPQMLLRVLDLHHPVNSAMPASVWHNHAEIGPLPPGGSQTVHVPIPHWKADLAHIAGATSHPFQAVVDPYGDVAELDESNNRSPVINVGVPSACAPPPTVRPDLTLLAGFDYACDTVTAHVILSYDGAVNGPRPPYLVTLRVTDPNHIGPPNLVARTVSIPGEGGSTAVRLTWLPADDPRTRDFTNTFTVTVDPDDRIPERNEGNNSVTVTGRCIR